MRMKSGGTKMRRRKDIMKREERLKDEKGKMERK
jgi:hypothetical protein